MILEGARSIDVGDGEREHISCEVKESGECLAVANVAVVLDTTITPSGDLATEEQSELLGDNTEFVSWRQVSMHLSARYVNTTTTPHEQSTHTNMTYTYQNTVSHTR